MNTTETDRVAVDYLTGEPIPDFPATPDGWQLLTVDHGIPESEQDPRVAGMFECFYRQLAPNTWAAVTYAPGPSTADRPWDWEIVAATSVRVTHGYGTTSYEIPASDRAATGLEALAAAGGAAVALGFGLSTC
jgi:hypothetical protein